MNLIATLMPNGTLGSSTSAGFLLFIGVLIGCTLGLILTAAYRFWQRYQAARALIHTKKVLSVGVVTSLVEDAISPEIGKAFDGFLRETIDILTSRMGSTAVIERVSPQNVEKALVDGQFDFVIVDGNIALTFSSKIELMPCYVSSLSALALIFWEKMPHHMMTLGDFAYYPNNNTAVLKNSLEEHYLSMFDSIKVRRVDSLTRLVVDLKLGLVRAGLVRMEQAKALKNDYGSIKFMPVSLQKQCFIQDEKIAVSRANKALIKELELKTTMVRREGIMKKIHAKWFTGLRPHLPKSDLMMQEQDRDNTPNDSAE